MKMMNITMTILLAFILIVSLGLCGSLLKSTHIENQLKPSQSNAFSYNENTVSYDTVFSKAVAESFKNNVNLKSFPVDFSKDLINLTHVPVDFANDPNFLGKSTFCLAVHKPTLDYNDIPQI